MAENEEKKSLAWPSALLGCLPSSKDVSSPSILKQQKAATSDEDDITEDSGLDDHDIFDNLTRQIDGFLNQARSQNEWSESLGSIATGMVFSSKSIASMSRVSKTVFDQLKSTEFKDIAKTAGEILAVMGKAHWAASGLLVVAAVIQNIEKLKRVDKDCISLLTSIHTVASTLRRFSNLPQIPHEMEANVQRAKAIISDSAACCLSIIHSPGYCKFMFARKNEGQVSSYRKELQSVQQELEFQLIFADYAERHETSGSRANKAKKRQSRHPQNEGQSRPEKHLEENTQSGPAQGGSSGAGEAGKEKSSGRKAIYNFGYWKEKIKLDKRREDRHTNSVFDDGLDSVTVITNKLEEDGEEKAVAVFLYGDKDTGKESDAQAVCNKLSADWAKVVIPETESAQQGGISSDTDIITALRVKILKKLKQTVSEADVEKQRDWENHLSTALNQNQKVCISIGLVPSSDIIKMILPMKIGGRNRIRVLLGTRDKAVLSALNGTVYKRQIHVMKALSYNDALAVFRKKLAADKPAVAEIIKICQGYKKRLKIARQHLFKYYTDDDEAFTRLSDWIKITQPNFDDLREYFNYDEKFLHLSVIAKDALLDICSFFSDWGWHETACIMEDDVLEKLKELQLVKRESEKVSVPPLVLAYCRSRSKGIRITGATDLHDVMRPEKEESGKFHAIRGIWMVENKFPFHISSSDLDKMENLRVLALGDWTTVTGKCSESFRQLRYFRTGRLGGLPFNSNRVDNQRVLENLRFLDNNSQLMFRWSSEKVPPTLRMVRTNAKELIDCLDLGKLPEGCQLAEMDLEGIAKEELPNTLCEIYSLQKINLSHCKNLKELPKSFGKLQCLKALDLSHCDVLKDLSPNFGWLSSLEKVSFSYCRQLQDLPDSMGLLSSVKEIDFSYCKSIEKLPKSIVKLSTLQVLKLTGCSHLLELPKEFENLDLKELYLESCKRLKALHESVEQTSSLSQKKVSLSWCRSVAQLSKGFINTIESQVEELILVGCMSLQILPEELSTQLNRLKILNLSGCKSLKRLPRGFNKMQYLEVLNLSSCEKLEELPAKLSRLLSLKELNLSNCHGLAGNCVDSLSKIQSLAYLDIHGSQKLVDRWNQLNRDKRICQLVVTTVHFGLGSRLFSSTLKNDSSIAKELKRGVYDFFNGKWLFVEINGQQFYPSTLEEGATLAVIFYHNYQIQELKALGEILDDLQTSCKYLQIVYVGTCVSELARELAGRHRVCGCDNYGAFVFFEKVLSTVKGFDQSISYAMVISDVLYKDSHRAFSEWTSITNETVRLRAKATKDFRKIDYIRLKEIIDTPKQSSQIEVLRALLLTKETKFLISKEKQVEIKTLEGKCIFLLLSWLHSMEAEYEDFNYVYESLRKKPLAKDQFEVVWIPIVVEGRGARDLNAKCVEKIEWLSIADPWSINHMVMRYFKRHTSFNKLPLLLAVSSSGRFCSDNLIPNTTNTEAERNMEELEAEAMLEMKKKRVIENMVREEVNKRAGKVEAEMKEMQVIEHMVRREVNRRVGAAEAEKKEKRVIEDIIREEVTEDMVREVEVLMNKNIIREEVERRVRKVKAMRTTQALYNFLMKPG